MNWRRVLIISGFFATVIVLAILIYSLFFAQETPTQVEQPDVTQPDITQPEQPTGSLTPSEGTGGAVIGDNISGEDVIEPSEVATGSITRLNTVLEDPVLAPTTTSNGQAISYYNTTDQKFYRVDANGVAQLLSDREFPDVENVYWSPNKSESIIEFPDGSNILYNFDTEEQITLPAHWQEFTFSPSGNEIVFKSIPLDKEDNYLAISDKNGGNARFIEPLGDNEEAVFVEWAPNNQVIGTYTEPLDFNRSELYFLGFNKENYRLTVVQGYGYQGHWSPLGDRILYSVYNERSDYKPTLWIVDAIPGQIGNNRTDLRLDTWADKCTFSSNTTLYCAVPEALESGAGLVPEAVQTNDLLFKIDLATRTRELLAIPEENQQMNNLTVTADGNTLYFTDESGMLKNIKLSE